MQIYVFLSLLGLKLFSYGGECALMILVTAFSSSPTIEKKEELCSVYDLQHLRVMMDHRWTLVKERRDI